MAAADPGPLAYPAGPYGGQVGGVVDNFSLGGYFNPSTTTGLANGAAFDLFTFDQIRTSGAKYALIQLAAYWCGLCIHGAKVMGENAPTLVPKGGFLMGVLTEGNTPDTAATIGNLDSWIKQVKAPYTYALDEGSVGLENFFNRQRDTFIIIDVSTMTVAQIIAADGDAAVAALGQLLDQVQDPPK